MAHSQKVTNTLSILQKSTATTPSLSTQIPNSTRFTTTVSSNKDLSKSRRRKDQDNSKESKKMTASRTSSISTMPSALLFPFAHSCSSLPSSRSLFLRSSVSPLSPLARSFSSSRTTTSSIFRSFVSSTTTHPSSLGFPTSNPISSSSLEYNLATTQSRSASSYSPFNTPSPTVKRLSTHYLDHYRQQSLVSSHDNLLPHLEFFRALLGENDNVRILNQGEEREERAIELVERFEELTGIWEGMAEKSNLEQPPEADEADSIEAARFPTVASPLLVSNEAFSLYIRGLSLVKASTDTATVIQSAVSRRQEILNHFKVSASDSIATSSSDNAENTTSSPTDTTTSSSNGFPEPKDLLMQILSRKKKKVAKRWNRHFRLLDPASPTSPSGGTSTSRIFRPSAGTGGVIAALRHKSTSSGLGSGSTGSSSSSSGGQSGSSQHPSEMKIVFEEYKGSIGFRIARFLGVTSVAVFVVLTFAAWFVENSGVLRAGAGPGAASQFSPEKKQDPATGKVTTFADVHGCDEAKEELYEVVEFLKDPERFAKLGGRLPRGVLLTGPPGTGKTLLARAVAGEAGTQFFSASGSEFDEMFVGVGARRIRELFKAARTNAPAIIFIDELDAIGSRRNPRDAHYIKQTLNQLLVELDGFNQSEGIILIGATNFPESLDPALTRPGRFDRHVVVSLPDVRGRIQILKHHLTSIRWDRTATDLSIIARNTPGFSGAELQNLVNQAAVKASSDGADAVRMGHFDWARNKIMMGAERRSAVITEDSKRATAYHEGGHTLVALYNNKSSPLHQVTVMPRGRALGVTQTIPEMDKNSFSYSEYCARLDVMMGGRCAEELIYGKENITDGASSDIDNATRLANMMVRRLGYSDALGPVSHHNQDDHDISPQTQALIEREVRTLIESAQSRALNLLKERRHELDRLAEALVEFETLSADEVRRVVAGEPLDDRRRMLANIGKATEGSDSEGSDARPVTTTVNATSSTLSNEN